jgi:hypothetical protein
MTDQPMRSRIGDYPINLHLGKASIDRNRYDAKPATRVDQLNVFGTVRQKKGKTVSSMETMCAERGRYALDTVFQLGKR